MKILETREGRPVRAGGWILVPETRQLRLAVPLGRGARLAWSWSWPAAVRVEAANGEVRRLPVADWTRGAQIVLLAAGVAGLLLARWARPRSTEGRTEGRTGRQNGKERR